MVAVPPAAIVPIGIPVAGLFVVGVPLTVTLFGMKVVPAGIISVMITLVAAKVPSLFKVIVYVIISPILAIVLSTVFTKATIAAKINVSTILLVDVRLIGGAPGAG
ncbi:hypothetical protein ADK18_17945 [Bacillus anthracis]|nr:hypothetical protein ADK18_17945 [Bacillus anthracis]